MARYHYPPRIINPVGKFVNQLRGKDFEDSPTEIKIIGKNHRHIVKDILDPGPNVKNVLIFAGGGQKCIFNAAFSKVMEELKVIDNIAAVVTCSSGAAGPWYWFGGNVSLGKSIITDDNCDNRLFSLKRPHKLYDLDALEQSLINKPIDYELLRARKPKFYIFETDLNAATLKDAEVVVDPRELKNPLKALLGTINIPVVNGGKKIVINNKDWVRDSHMRSEQQWVDGSMINPLPITWAIDMFKGNDPETKLNILVVLTRSLLFDDFGIPLDMTQLHEEPGFAIIAAILKHMRVPRDSKKRRLLKEILMLNPAKYHDELEYLLGIRDLPEGVSIAGIYPHRTSLQSYTVNSNALEEAYDAMYDATVRLFTKTH